MFSATYKLRTSSINLAIVAALSILLQGCGVTAFHTPSASSTPAPGSGTPAPGSGTPAPGSGTPAPGSGTPAPGSGTPAPGSGTPAPGSADETLPNWAASGFFGTSGASTFNQLPTFYVADYGASGSAVTGSCSAKSASTLLACTLPTDDFKVGQGIMVQSAGPVPATLPITVKPIVTRRGDPVIGHHTYCYIVTTVDPLGGITTPSPQTCVSDEPDLTYTTTYNDLITDGLGTVENTGPTPTFLWYVSDTDGPWQLVSAVAFTSGTQDLGQRPGSRGGWPNNFDYGNLNISKNQDFFTHILSKQNDQIVTTDLIPSAASDVLLKHDDTDAVQKTINSAAAAGGGIIQLGSSDYNIAKPSFHGANGTHSSNFYNYAWSSPVSYLYLPDDAAGRISLQGTSLLTVIHTPPDHDGSMLLWEFGSVEAPFIPDASISIEEAAKGSLTLTLKDGVSAGSLQTGDDIEIFSGDYNSGNNNCQATNGEPSNCHFSELNTIIARIGNTLTLAYPTSKRYFVDQNNSSFGITVRTHPGRSLVPHMIAIQHMTVDSYNPIVKSGDVIGLWINDVHMIGSISNGFVAGGSKRDVTIENSSWGLGSGSAYYVEEEEMDKWTNVIFRNNDVVGFAALGAEGPSQAARLYGTEGSSQFTYEQNRFNNVSVYFDQTTDDLIRHNTFVNGIIKVGTTYGPSTAAACYSPVEDSSFLSYSSQSAVIVDTNTLTFTPDHNVPFVILSGDFTSSIINHNTIMYNNDAENVPLIVASSGDILSNSLTLSGGSTASTPICLIPDQSPATAPTSFNVKNNNLTGNSVLAGIHVPNQGFSDPSPTCIADNSYAIKQGPQVRIDSPDAINLKCQ